MTLKFGNSHWFHSDERQLINELYVVNQKTYPSFQT